MYLSLPERTKYVEGSAPRGLRRDTDKNPASHAIRGDGGSVPESPRRGGEDPKHTHMWLTLIITHTHTAQEDVERFTAHITRLSVGNRAASPTSSLLGTRPRNGLGDSGGRGLAKGSEARARFAPPLADAKGRGKFPGDGRGGGRARLQGCPSQTSETSQTLHSLSFSNTRLSQLL